MSSEQIAVVTHKNGSRANVTIQREHDGWYWATAGRQNSDRGYTLRANREAYKEVYRDGELLSSELSGTWEFS